MRVIIAIRSIISISNSIDYKNGTRSQKIATSVPRTQKRKQRDQASAASLGKLLEHFLAQTSLFVSNLLTFLDTMFASAAGKTVNGNALLLNISNLNRTKYKIGV
jgi:hypothetical protein